MGEAFRSDDPPLEVTVVRLPNRWYVFNGRLYDQFGMLEQEIFPDDSTERIIKVRLANLEEKADWMTRIAMNQVKPVQPTRITRG